MWEKCATLRGMKRTTATSDEVEDHIQRRFRERLATMRTQLGYTQSEMGLTVGLSRFAIGDIEAGNRNVKLSEAVRGADALQVDLVKDMLADAEPVLVVEPERRFFRRHEVSR